MTLPAGRRSTHWGRRASCAPTSGSTANYPFASPLQWGSTLDLNLRAPMLATQLVLEPMRRRGGGAVINVASTGGVGLAPYESPEYGAAKAGLIRFTACMA